MSAKNGRWLDMEVGYFNGDKKWTGIFYEDGGVNYSNPIHTTNTERGLQNRLNQYQTSGHQIIDFEAYEEDGVTKYAGVWSGAARQPRTHLYYGLLSNEVSNLLRPLHGRVIDFERYRDPDRNDQIRYALIVAAYPGGDWGLFRGLDAQTLAARHASNSDSNTHMIDLEMWGSGEDLTYAAVWGDTNKALHEVAAIADENNTINPPIVGPQSGHESS